jgi:transposase-like protein
MDTLQEEFMEQVEKILDLISSLSQTQIATLKDALEVLPSSKEAKRVGDIKVKKHPSIDCPHCACNLVKGHGQYKGRKRYKCCFCSKTFTELTDTPISNTKYPEKWNDFVKCSIDGLSLRKTAEKLGIHVATAFKWRHKLMGAYISDQKLTGIAEADETFFLYSEKGSRSVAQRRKPRKRGGKAKSAGISDDQIPVIVGKDRDKSLIAGVVGRGRVSAKDIELVLEEHIEKDTTLCSDAHPSFKAFAKANKIKYVQLNIKQGKRVIRKKYHIQNVNNAHSYIKKWMARFNGVATKYLQNYMNWYCLMEEIKDSKNQSKEFAQKVIHLNIDEEGRI